MTFLINKRQFEIWTSFSNREMNYVVVVLLREAQQHHNNIVFFPDFKSLIKKSFSFKKKTKENERFIVNSKERIFCSSTKIIFQKTTSQAESDTQIDSRHFEQPPELFPGFPHTEIDRYNLFQIR